MLADACVRRRGLKQGVRCDSMIRELLEYTLEPFQRFREVTLLYITSTDLKYRIGYEPAAVVFIDYRRIVSAGAIKVSIELIYRRTFEMVVIGEGRLLACDRFQVVQAAGTDQSKIVRLCRI